jgi:hypothetical protein
MLSLPSASRFALATGLVAAVAILIASDIGHGGPAAIQVAAPANSHAITALVRSDPTPEPANRAAAVMQAAFASVAKSGGVPISTTRNCPSDRLAVSYAKPTKHWASGAFISPLGPTPTESTTAVNGIVICRDAAYGIGGFTATLTSTGWDVELVPDPAGGPDGEHGNTTDNAPRPKPVKKGTPINGALTGAAIEGYARYEGQSSCSPTAKPGTLALRNLLLARYGNTSSLGITRGCSVGGRSEHKEGRAFDWGANVHNKKQRAAVESFIASLMATDQYGNRHALVRRMGVMYLIWNHHIWSAYSADAGWRPYTGSSPHTDHMHISLSWAGARAQTSFWSGNVVAGLPDNPLSAAGGSGNGKHSFRPVSTSSGNGHKGTRPTHHTHRTHRTHDGGDHHDRSTWPAHHHPTRSDDGDRDRTGDPARHHDHDHNHNHDHGHDHDGSRHGSEV